jgi:hypothetical protein
VSAEPIPIDPEDIWLAGADPSLFEMYRQRAKGRVCIPIVPGTKKAAAADWSGDAPHLEFAPNSGTALRLDDLTDLDLDCREAVVLASLLLPTTSMKSGRPAAGQPSHYFYAAPGGEYEKFEDIDSKTLLEIRTGIGHYTVIPPSVMPADDKGNGYPSEAARWYADGEPAEHDAETLRQRAVDLAIAALLVRHLGKNGFGHEVKLAFAGTLLNAGLKANEVITIGEAISSMTNDEKSRDLAGTVNSTAERIAGGEEATGAPTLAKIIGENGPAVVDRIREWLGQDVTGDHGLSDADRARLDALNQKHALVFQQNGSLVVITEMMESGEAQIRFSGLPVMRDLYVETVTVGATGRGQPIRKKLGQAWLDWPGRRQYNGIELAPRGSQPNEGYYNMWRGFSVEPKKGDWSLFHDHITTVLACGNAKHAHYIRCWMAKCVQQAGRQAETSLAFRGGQGVGKSTFAVWFGSLFGVHFLHLDSAHQLTGRFNAHLHNAIVVFADEAVWAGGKAGLGTLKRMVTADTLDIERKGVDLISVKNMVHLIVASNEDFVVPKAFDDRRFAVFDVGAAHQNDRPYFRAIEQQLFKDGGLAAMLYDLLEWNIDIDLLTLPQTAAGDEQKQYAADPLSRWWFERLRAGSLMVGQGWPPNVLSGALHGEYLDFVNRHYPGDHNPRSTQSQLGKFLAKYAPGNRQRKLVEDTQTMFRSMPSLEECRDIWKKAAHLSEDFEW